MASHSFETYSCVGMALDPIHVGTGGSRLGRVDLAIMRDPVTQIPKIPGSSLAGVLRAYVAMEKGKYPQCAGLGQPKSSTSSSSGTSETSTSSTNKKQDNSTGHCGQPDCPVCTVFGFARGIGDTGGFAGLAAFSDMHILLFPIATNQGPRWLTCPLVLHQTVIPCWNLASLDNETTVYMAPNNNAQQENTNDYIKLGWLYLPVKRDWDSFSGVRSKIQDFKVPEYICNNLAVVSDKLFIHLVNNNLEVRTSVAINPQTGAAEEGALFTYEALPRGTVLYWELTCRHPQHFKIKMEKNNEQEISAVKSPEDVAIKVSLGHTYLEHLGIGGMGSRGMGRLRVLYPEKCKEKAENGEEATEEQK